MPAGNDGPSPPASRIWYSTSMATSRSVMPGRMRATVSASATSAIVAARCSSASSAASLMARMRSIIVLSAAMKRASGAACCRASSVCPHSILPVAMVMPPGANSASTAARNTFGSVSPGGMTRTSSTQVSTSTLNQGCRMMTGSWSWPTMAEVTQSP